MSQNIMGTIEHRDAGVLYLLHKEIIGIVLKRLLFSPTDCVHQDIYATKLFDRFIHGLLNGIVIKSIHLLYLSLDLLCSLASLLNIYIPDAYLSPFGCQ